MSEQLPHDEELRSLYRKLPADEPRAELDDAILTAARRRNDVERRRTLIRRLRWTIPMAAAAGVVLTLTLTRLTPEQQASPAAFAPKPAALAVPQKLPEDSSASSDETREEAAPVAQPDDLKALGYIGGDAPAAPDSRAAGNDALVLDPPAARKDAAPTAPALSNEALVSAPAPAPAPPRSAPKSEAAYAEAAPPETAPADAAPAEAARAKSRTLGRVAKMAPAPEAKELDAADRAASTALQATIGEQPRDNAASGGSSYGAFEAPAAVDAWPFGLEAGLGAQEACRRVHEALHRDCEFRAGLVDLPLDPVATIDRGRHAGRSVSRLTLALHDDKLWSAVFALPLPDGTIEQFELTSEEPAATPKQ